MPGFHPDKFLTLCYLHTQLRYYCVLIAQSIHYYRKLINYLPYSRVRRRLRLDQLLFRWVKTRLRGSLHFLGIPEADQLLWGQVTPEIRLKFHRFWSMPRMAPWSGCVTDFGEKFTHVTVLEQSRT